MTSTATSKSTRGCQFCGFEPETSRPRVSGMLPLILSKRMKNEMSQSLLFFVKGIIRRTLVMFVSKTYYLAHHLSKINNKYRQRICFTLVTMRPKCIGILLPSILPILIYLLHKTMINEAKKSLLFFYYFVCWETYLLSHSCTDLILHYGQ